MSELKTNQNWIESSVLVRNTKQFLNQKRYPLNKPFKKYNGECIRYSKAMIIAYQNKLA
tara:strand:- start:371 stop:547 length:177 start_codon:yes stop_codon:yes gene_type:complete